MWQPTDKVSAALFVSNYNYSHSAPFLFEQQAERLVMPKNLLTLCSELERVKRLSSVDPMTSECSCIEKSTLALKNGEVKLENIF